MSVKRSSYDIIDKKKTVVPVRPEVQNLIDDRNFKNLIDDTDRLDEEIEESEDYDDKIG